MWRPTSVGHPDATPRRGEVSAAADPIEGEGGTAVPAARGEDPCHEDHKAPDVEPQVLLGRGSCRRFAPAVARLGCFDRACDGNRNAAR
jgi:hypothetical protein